MYNIKSLEEVMIDAIERARVLRNDGKHEEAELELQRVPTDMSVYELTEEMEIVYE